MSLINSACCCPTPEELGRCCILDTDTSPQDCVDLCENNKTPAQCAALGGVWELGECADVEPEPCVGVCCATTTAGYFVACQESVTQCECFSDNLAVGVNTTWTSGPQLTCVDIACPCRCADSCTSVQLIDYSELIVYSRSPCNLECTFTETTNEFTPGYVGVNIGNNGEDCNTQYWIDYWIAQLTSTNSTSTPCYAPYTKTYESYTFTSGATVGAVLTPVSICNPPQQNVGNHTYSYICTADHPNLDPQCQCPSSNYSTSVPVFMDRPYCNTCGYENCVHVYDDCENC